MRPIVFLFALYSSVSFAQFHRIAPTPDWVVTIPIEGVVIGDTSCSSGGIEYLLADRQFHLGQQHDYYRLVTRLATPEAVQNGSRVEVDVDPTFQKLLLHAVRIIRDGRPIEMLQEAQISVLQRERDLNAFLYDGTRSILVELHDVRPGDIIDQSYTIVGNDASGDGRFHRLIPMGFGVPLARHHIRFVTPIGRKLDFKSHLIADDATQKSTKWGVEHIWYRENVPCLIPEDGTPAWYSPFAELEATEFKDLEDLRRWAVEQFDVDMDLGPDLLRVVHELEDIADTLVRIDSAIHLVQRKVRYLGLEGGISAYRPRPPAKVYAQRFGDCKDRSLLLVALLREMGVKAWPALVNSSSGRDLERHLPRPGLFDHCIAMIEHDGAQFWVDPTLTHNRGQLTERYTPDMGFALVVDLGTNGWSPMRTNELGITEVHETYTLDSLGGGAVLRVESRYKRRQADRLRSWFAGQSISSISEQYRDYYRASFDKIEVLDLLSIQDDIENNVVITKEHYAIAEMWDTIPGGGFKFSISPNVLRDYIDQPTLRTRRTPYALADPLEFLHRITLHMPEPWNVTEASEVIEGFGVRYESMLESNGSVIDLTYQYRSDSLVVQAEDMALFFDQQKRIDDDLGRDISHSGHATSFSLWDQTKTYATLLAMLALALWGAWRIRQWDPEPHADSIGQPTTTIGGWLILPLIGLFIAPLMILYQVYDAGAWFFQAPLYVPVLEVKSKLALHLYFLFFQAEAIAMLGLVGITLFLFLKRRTNVAVLMQGIYIGNLVFLVVDALLYEWLDLHMVLLGTYDVGDISRAFFAAAIWIPYFRVSERVRTTFVRRSNAHVPMVADNVLH